MSVIAYQQTQHCLSVSQNCVEYFVTGNPCGGQKMANKWSPLDGAHE